MVRKLLQVKAMVAGGAVAAVLGSMRYGGEVPWAVLLGQVMVAAAAVAAGGQWVGWMMEKRRNKLPGPIPFPVVGNLVQVATASRSRLPHAALAHLARNYGPLFHLQLGVVPTLVASTPSAAHLILSHHDSSLSNRPLSPSISRLFYHPSKSAFMCPLGDPWRFTRKFYSLHLLNPRYVHESHVPALVDETLRLIFGDVYAASLVGAEVDLSTLFYSLQRSVMYRAVFGKRPPEVLPKLTTPEFYRLVLDADAALGSAQIGTFVPALRFLDVRCREDGAVDRCHRVFDAMLEGALCERERERYNADAASSEDRPATGKHGGGGRCILDKLLALDPPLDRERMKAMMLELLSGGSHTTALALDWAMAELLSNEKVMRKAVEEVDGVVGKERMVSIEDVERNKLPYIRAIVKETLRLHPTAPLLIPRLAMAPCELQLDSKTYRIAANTLVVVNAWAIGRDEATWGPTASVFAPERFLVGSSANVDVRGQNFELIPFGAGRRICPGVAIAMPTLELTIATFLHCFQWGTAPGRAAVDMSERLGLTLPRRSPLLAIPMSFRLDPKLVASHSHLHLHTTTST